MSVIALLSVSPATEDSMAADIADALQALEEFDVEYETTAMGTIIEAADVETVLEATAAAHNAVEADRVGTLLKIDEKRAKDQSAEEKVHSVEQHLGRPAQSEVAGHD